MSTSTPSSLLGLADTLHYLARCLERGDVIAPSTLREIAEVAEREAGAREKEVG